MVLSIQPRFYLGMLLGVLLLGFAPRSFCALHGDDGDDRHELIPLDLQGDKAARAFLDKKLGRAREARGIADLEELKRLAMQLKPNELSEEDQKRLLNWPRDYRNSDPQTKKLMEKLLEDDQIKKKFSDAQLEEMKKLVQDIKPPKGTGEPKSSGSISSTPIGPDGKPIQPDKSSPPGSGSAVLPPTPPTPPISSGELRRPEPKKKPSDFTSKLTSDLLGKSGILSKPPNFKKALSRLADARRSRTEDEGDDKHRLPSLGKLFKPEKSSEESSGTSTVLDRIKSTNLNGPTGSSPGMDSSRASGLEGFAVLFITLTLIGITVYVLVRLWRRRFGGAQLDGWRLGPWPVDPASVATREQLIRGFEYLAVLVLGRPARHRNHLEIAQDLPGATADPEQRRRAADELAAIYEQARYAPGNEPLDEIQLTAARRGLTLLAGLRSA